MYLKDYHVTYRIMSKSFGEKAITTGPSKLLSEGILRSEFPGHGNTKLSVSFPNDYDKDPVLVLSTHKYNIGGMAPTKESFDSIGDAIFVRHYGMTIGKIEFPSEDLVDVRDYLVGKVRALMTKHIQEIESKQNITMNKILNVTEVFGRIEEYGS